MLHFRVIVTSGSHMNDIFRGEAADSTRTNRMTSNQPDVQSVRRFCVF